MTASKKTLIPDAQFTDPNMPPPYQHQFEWIDADDAATMLAKNDHNRSLSKGTVTAYELDMVLGQFPFNGATIVVADDGTLIDGAHRLTALKNTGKGRWLLVVRGLPLLTQDTVDQGRPRKFSDVLRIREVRRYTAVAAITRRLCYWERGVRTRGSSSGRASTPVLDKVLADNPDIHFSAEIAGTVKSHVGIPESILGICHLLFYRIDADDAEFFFARLRDGHELAADHPIAVLRRAVASAKGDSTRLTETMLMAFSIKAWNAYRTGETISRLTFRPGGSKPEPFPEPV